MEKKQTHLCGPAAILYLYWIQVSSAIEQLMQLCGNFCFNTKSIAK